MRIKKKQNNITKLFEKWMEENEKASLKYFYNSTLESQTCVKRWWILKKGVWSVEPSWKSSVWQKQPQITHIMEFETVDKAWKKWNRPEILLSERGLRSELVWLCEREGEIERESSKEHTLLASTPQSARRGEARGRRLIGCLQTLWVSEHQLITATEQLIPLNSWRRQIAGRRQITDKETCSN